MENKIEKGVHVMCNILLNIAALALFGILVSVTVQIIIRNFFPHIPCPWTEELAKYLLIWMCFAGSPVALLRGEHLMVDLFYNMYPQKLRQWIHLALNILVIGFCVYLLVFGMELCLNPLTWRMKSPSAGFPRLAVYAALPFGAFFMLLVGLWDSWVTIQMLRGKREDTTGKSIVDESLTMEEIDALKAAAAAAAKEGQNK